MRLMRQQACQMKQASRQASKQACKQEGKQASIFSRMRLYVAGQGMRILYVRPSASREVCQKHREALAAGCESPLLLHAAECSPQLPRESAPPLLPQPCCRAHHPTHSSCTEARLLSARPCRSMLTLAGAWAALKGYRRRHSAVARGRAQLSRSFRNPREQRRLGPTRT